MWWKEAEDKQLYQRLLGNEEERQLVISLKNRSKILKYFYDSIFGCHMGMVKTLLKTQTQDLANQTLTKSQANQKHYDKKAKEIEYSVSQMVWCINHRRAKGVDDSNNDTHMLLDDMDIIDDRVAQKLETEMSELFDSMQVIDGQTSGELFYKERTVVITRLTKNTKNGKT
uniref:Uncharacterized protein n=1 Tax=Romanomermis culicivorax TaxID=13658 RepID=A0A915K8L4_ROMCU